jgi:hypothetical protein
MKGPGVPLGSQVRGILARQLESMETGRNQIAPPRQLQGAVEDFRRRFGGLGIGHVPQDRLGQAIIALQRRGIAALTRGSRFILAYSLARPLSQLAGDSILEQDDLALPLIESWEQEFRKGTLAPMHWKGLIFSYLQAPSTANANRLRVLLLSSLAAIVVKHRNKPLWLEIIDRHHHLLGRRPCDPYVRELLEGGSALLDDLRKVVSIPKRSWLWESMNRALVEEVRQMSDHRFRQVRRNVLGYAEEDPASRSAVRAAVLDRESKLRAGPAR